MGEPYSSGILKFDFLTRHQEPSLILDNHPCLILGLEDEILATRRDTIRLHIYNLMQDMYSEEECLKAKLIESVAHCTKELAELCTQLSLPFDGVSTQLLAAFSDYIIESFL